MLISAPFFPVLLDINNLIHSPSWIWMGVLLRYISPKTGLLGYKAYVYMFANTNDLALCKQPYTHPLLIFFRIFLGYMHRGTRLYTILFYSHGWLVCIDRVAALSSFLAAMNKISYSDTSQSKLVLSRFLCTSSNLSLLFHLLFLKFLHLSISLYVYFCISSNSNHLAISLSFYLWKFLSFFLWFQEYLPYKSRNYASFGFRH